MKSGPGFQATGSIVLYRDDPDMLSLAVGSFLGTGLSVRLFLLDNSPDRRLESTIADPRVEYVFLGRNLGFGRAHNIAFERALGMSQYHFVINPDVAFPPGTLESLVDFMDRVEKAGMVMPRILSPSGETQYLRRLLPTPADLFFRRFLPHFRTTAFRNRLYETRFADYAAVTEAPWIPGCFFCIRVEALRDTGGFDDRFFLYLEDVDLSRRIGRRWKTFYYPEAAVTHRHARRSYRWGREFFIHLASAVKYFNKWGWLRDPERSRVNRETLRSMTPCREDN